MQQLSVQPKIHEIVDIVVEVGRSGIAAFTRLPDDSIYPGMLNMVTGHIKRDGGYSESPLSAAVREFTEETGLAVAADRFAFACEYTYTDEAFGAQFRCSVYVLRISYDEFIRIAETEHVPGSKRIIPYDKIAYCLDGGCEPSFNPVEKSLLSLFSVRRE